MKEKIIIIRKRLFELIEGYWWVILIIIAIGYFFTDVPIFRYAIYIVAVPFALLLFLPFILQFFSPFLILISSLIEHFKESKNMPFGKKYIFMPMSLVGAMSFVTAQIILSTGVFIISFIAWASVIGFFFTFLLIFLFGLAPLAILTAPFLIWYNTGLVEFFAVVLFFLLTLFWYSFSKLAFSEDYYSSTPEDFLGYSPQTFLLGALSLQIIALPLYKFEFFTAGDIISDLGGAIFLLLALVSVFKWRSAKKKLTKAEKENLYKPSVWIYILGFFVTNILYVEFQEMEVPTAVTYWLNLFFFVAMVSKFFSFIKRKIKHL